MVVLIFCLLASMAIGAIRLATTPTEILGAGFRDLPASKVEQSTTRKPDRR
jgi:hypothetical protein